MSAPCGPEAQRCDAATRAAWAALGGPPELLERIAYGSPSGALPARLPVRALARATVAVCSLAAAELAARRGTVPVPTVRVDDAAVGTAFTSERHLRIDGRAPTSFAPLSGFWRTADGWVRTHANYPHHRAHLLSALGIADDAPQEAQANRLAPPHAASAAIMSAIAARLTRAPARSRALPRAESRRLRPRNSAS